MSALASRLVKVGAAVVVVALLLLGIRLLTSGPAQKTATAYFPVAVHVYAGSDVDVLGVKVGSVESVTPQGTRVKVVLRYNSSQRVPRNVSAVVLDPTLVADRVVQLAPVYSGGPTLADGATIPLQNNAVPVELDELNQNLVTLSDALGPKGANANGALSRAIRVGENNLRGNGTRAHTAMTRLSQLVGTLDDNRSSLFSTIDNLQSFTSTLAADDSQTRAFTADLAKVSGELDSERGAFSAALHNLQLALGEVAGFIKDNRQQLASDVGGLASVTQVLAKERTLLAHMIDIGAVGVSNYPHMYTPSQRTYNARFDGNAISDNPALFVCQLLGSAGGSPSDCLKVLKPLANLPIPSPGAKR